MTQIAPNRFPEARTNGVALMRAIAEAEAQDRLDREREADLAGRPDGYRPGRIAACAVILCALLVIFALVLEYYLRGLS